MTQTTITIKEFEIDAETGLEILQLLKEQKPEIYVAFKEVLDRTKLSERAEAKQTSSKSDNKALAIQNVSVTSLIKHIQEQVKEYSKYWSKSQEKDNPLVERKMYGNYMAYKSLADGIRNGYFKDER